MRKIRLIYTLLGCFFVMNCAKSKDAVVFMNNLKENIANEYNTDQIEVKVNEDEDSLTLVIFITDAKFNSYSVKQKREMAKSIGEFVRNTKGKSSPIETGELIFKNKTNGLLVKTTDSESYKIY